MRVNRTAIAPKLLFVSMLALPSGAAAQTGGVLAVVNGVPITAAEVDAKLGASLTTLQEQIYELQQGQLDTLIEEQLLQQEAKRRGITTDALVETEIRSRVEEATTADASAFYEANKAKLPGVDFAGIEQQIKTYLTAQRASVRRQEFVASLRAAARVDTYLEPPPPFRAEVAIGEAYSLGNPDAPVTIVEFSDFHCPFCRQAHGIVQQVLARYGDAVRLVYKDMPLDSLHPDARAAAEAALCAGAQGKFWEYHDALFASEPDVSVTALSRLTKQVGLDAAAFDACYSARTYKARVEATVQEGARLGVTGTPTFFINGRNLTGAQPLERFVKIIDEELKAARPTSSPQNP
jgi:protein-disulfide isomerase